MNRLPIFAVLWITLGAGAVAQNEQSLPPLFGQSGLKQTVSDGPVQLTIELSQRSAQVAQPVDLRIQVDAPASAKITLPKLPATLGSLTVIQSEVQEDVPVVGEPSTRRWVAGMQLESLALGEHEIPALEVIFQLPASVTQRNRGRRGTISSQPMTLQITSVLQGPEDPTQFREIKDLAELPPAVPESSMLPWVLGASATTMLAVVGLVVWSRRRKPLDPIAWSLGQVDEIQSQFDSGEIDHLTTLQELTHLLREFFAIRLSIPATAQSSEELDAALANRLDSTTTSDSVRQRVMKLMTIADELKFAGQSQESGVIADNVFDSVRVIIRDATTETVSKDPDTR